MFGTGRVPPHAEASSVETTPPSAGTGSTPRQRARQAAPFLAVVAGVALAGIAVLALAPGPAALTQRDVAEAVADALDARTPAPPISELVYAVARPSLVLVRTERAQAAAGPSLSPGHGVGAGVVIDRDGQLLTALHVVRGASTIRVTFADGTASNAALVGSDDSRDIAVLRPETVPAVVMPATIGNPRRLRIGSEAYVVGNPFGLYGSLSAGIVSGLERSFQDPETRRRYTDLIQFDAAVNPGSSGGPLLDRNGRVVGIVTALVNPTDEEVFIGIGFAVPIDAAGGAAEMPPY
jgi:S1-C subfamily serine protease